MYVCFILYTCIKYNIMVDEMDAVMNFNLVLKVYRIVTLGELTTTTRASGQHVIAELPVYTLP